MRKPIILLFAVFIGLESFSCSCEDLGPNDSLWYKKVYKNENYTLDSIIRKRVPPHDTILGKEFFYYYANGNLKNHEDYYYQGDLLKTHRKYLYEYDDENRMNVSIWLVPTVENGWKEYEKTVYIWFSDDYFSEKVHYEYGDTSWIPNTKSISPDIGNQNSFTMYNLRWNSINGGWDTLTKNINHLNEESQVYQIDNYQWIEGWWSYIGKTIKEYTENGNILLEQVYLTHNNGNTFYLVSSDEYEYNSQNLPIYRIDYFDAVLRYYNSYRWVWNGSGNIFQYYTYQYFPPSHPEETGGIVNEYVYTEQGLIWYVKVFSSNQYHSKNEFYHFTNYSNTIDINTQEVKLYPNPSTSYITLKYDLLKSSLVQLYMYDINGRQVKSMSQNQSQGRQTCTLNLNGMLPGIYFIKILFDRTTYSQKVIIAK
jgi:hypothetical protein